MIGGLIFWYVTIMAGQFIALYVGFSGSSIWILAPLGVLLVSVDAWFKLNVGSLEAERGVGPFFMLLIEHGVSLLSAWGLGWLLAWLVDRIW